ncbi:unnamed protein product [Rhizophagus irregularis]|uniref:Uncharacterized protein n=1 Tax=Rhizophagus irregularis TaxID=588596 RepID=A0A916E8L2_9GLOM|nr:unnamed protein product [Rhizophagus irregularis]
MMLQQLNTRIRARQFIILSKSHSLEIIGASYNVPIILEQGDDRVEIEDGFAVIEEEKNEPFILLGAPWLHHSWMKPIVNESVQRIASQYPHSCEHSLCVKKLEEQLEKLNNS